jgi:hypothetical protein
LEVLKAFVPTAKRNDWNLEAAGQRVQISRRIRFEEASCNSALR